VGNGNDAPGLARGIPGSAPESETVFGDERCFRHGPPGFDQGMMPCDWHDPPHRLAHVCCTIAAGRNPVT
jgi:hypothetical protein